MHIMLNPNKEDVKRIKEAITNNGGYCPCQTEKNENTRCICKSFSQQEKGWCHCGLYYKEK